ncbi:ATP-binding cassette domain-containing protein [Winogradskya humida]|uniref:ABC transporter permease n=1 Tax=Winogradskya humida TaxID=113566 RepID=A0ABQ4A1H0_9ACTN|nr:ABC transporter ATP-binding protein [Actinoplanes humidus]GIE24549.1 ABC transporter permease [Actinoplanes humidus]
MSRTEALRRLYLLSWRLHRGPVAAYLALTVCDILATGAFALSLRELIQAALGKHLAPALYAAGGAALSWTVTIIGGAARGNVGNLLTEALSRELDVEILQLIGRFGELARTERPEHADRTAMVRGSGEVIAHGIWTLVDGAATIVRLVVVVGILILVAPVLLVLVVLLVPALLLPRRGQRRIRAAAVAGAQDVRLAGHLHTLLTDPAPNTEVRIAGAGPALHARAEQAWERVARRQASAQWAAAGIGASGWALFILGYTAAMLLIVHQVTTGRAQPGDVLLIATLAGTLRTQAEGAVRALHRTADGMSALDAYTWLHREAGATVTAVSPGRIPERLHRGIRLHRVSFDYGPGREVLREVDLTLPAGSTVAVVGEHGAGKTTLVKLLCKLYEPTGGTITVDEVPLAELSTGAWWQRTTASFQDFARFFFVARESVGVGDLAALDDDQRITRAVRDGDAEQVIAGLPDGLGTRLGRSFGGAELSRGQWQRIALSRAAMRVAPLLCVIDEPTASLDARSEYAVYQRQLTMAKSLAGTAGTVTVVVSHRFSTVRTADLIVVLGNGRIVEQGDHEQLMALGGTYAELYRLQAAAYLDDRSAVQ